MGSPTLMMKVEAQRSEEIGKNSPISFRRHRRCVSYNFEESRRMIEYSGWIYHLGVNSIGHDYCHLRFLFIRGKYVEMYKRDPQENTYIKPIRRGVIGTTLVVDDLGPRKTNNGELFVIRFYSRLDEAKRGEIGCASAEEAQRWMETFDQAKQKAEYDILKGGCSRSRFAIEADINLDGHRPRVRRYAQELKKLIRIGQGPDQMLRRQYSNLGEERLLRTSSNLTNNITSDGFFEGNFGDVIEGHEWKCVRTINGVRILEDVADSKNRRGALVKAVAVVDATADTVLELILDLDKHKRYEWDTLTSDLELIDSYEGNYDVVYGTYDPKYLTRWQSKRDFVFSRQWFRGQDGTYTILQLPVAHKKQPPRSGYNRTKIHPSTWEIRNLNTPMGLNTKCLITQMLEIYSAGWGGWKKNNSSKFEKSIPFALLSQVAGLKEYIEASPALTCGSSMIATESQLFDFSSSNDVYEDVEVSDEFFYDAISADSSSSSEHETEDIKNDGKELDLELKKVAPTTTNFSRRQSSGSCSERELDHSVESIKIIAGQLCGCLPEEKEDANSNCWSSPSGSGFMIRGKSYLKDNDKVTGGDPLLQLIAVDWFKVDKTANRIAQHPRCLVQSEAGKKLPFILVMNLQVPAKPNYSLVLYYVADRPVNKNSLLGKFIDGTDAFRDSRFKLIPSIVEGYWMVKRAVGTKACLLGKAVSCNYFREDNFLEIDVDIGSSSVARSVIGLVLGYVTSLVVDLAILFEAKEEEELPEYILGTVRLNRVRLDAAVTLDI